MFLWAVAVAGVCVACAAWARAGRTARKLEALNQSYWELRYDYTRLRSQLARLDPESDAAADEAATQAAAPKQQVAFVSLSSMKKKG